MQLFFITKSPFKDSSLNKTYSTVTILSYGILTLKKHYAILDYWKS